MFASNFIRYLLPLFLVSISSETSAQCVGGQCPLVLQRPQVIQRPPIVQRGPVQQQRVAERPPASVCRVRVDANGGVQFGSGTLVATRGAFGYVLSCQHLFRERADRTAVLFGNGRSYESRVVAVDTRHDLSLLELAVPSAKPASVNASLPSGLLTAGGFGGNGLYRTITGPLVGDAMPSGARSASVKIRGMVRPGDSGGPVFSTAGALVGVVWGTSAEGVTYATVGEPIRQMMKRIPAGRPPNASGNGMVAVNRRKPLANDNGQDRLAQRVDQLQQQVEGWKPCRCPPLDTQQFASKQELQQFVRRDEWRAEAAGRERKLGELLERMGKRAPTLSILQVLAGALGIGSPVGVAILAGGWLARRQKRRRRASSGDQRGVGGPRGSTFRNGSF